MKSVRKADGKPAFKWLGQMRECTDSLAQLEKGNPAGVQITMCTLWEGYPRNPSWVGPGDKHLINHWKAADVGDSWDPDAESE